MKKNYLKITSLLLCLCIVLTGIRSIAYAGSGDSQTEPQVQTVQTAAVSSGANTVSKDETVYVFAVADVR